MYKKPHRRAYIRQLPKLIVSEIRLLNLIFESGRVSHANTLAQYDAVLTGNVESLCKGMRALRRAKVGYISLSSAPNRPAI
jgi:hypothetical protein